MFSTTSYDSSRSGSRRGWRRAALGVTAALAIATSPIAPCAQALSPAFTPFGVSDWDGDGNQDIVARHNSTGDLWLYPGESVRGYGSEPRVQIGSGWGAYTPFGVSDWDGDGNQDIVARHNRTGDLWLYPGESVRGYGSEPRVQIGSGWGAYTPFGVSDWDGDGDQDIVARHNSTRVLWLYPGESVRGYGTEPRVKIGNGW